jgi:hypothetical protein
VTPLAKTLKAVYLKYGVAYRLSRFETGQNVGDWLVVVQYANMAAYEKAPASFAQDPNGSRPLPRFQRSRRGSAENSSSISIFDTAGFAPRVIPSRFGSSAFTSTRLGGDSRPRRGIRCCMHTRDTTAGGATALRS